MGAILTRSEIAEVLTPGTHGTTSGGNPLACAVGLAAVIEISQPAFLAGVRDKTAAMQQELEAIGQRTGAFADVRGLGLWFGCELQGDYQDCAVEIVHNCLAQGVMTLVAGPNVLRLAPALNTDQDTLMQGLARLEAALTL